MTELTTATKTELGRVFAPRFIAVQVETGDDNLPLYRIYEKGFEGSYELANILNWTGNRPRYLDVVRDHISTLESGGYLCPYAGTAYRDVPGYDEGRGCPVCGGLGAHVELVQRDRARIDAHIEEMGEDTTVSAYLKLVIAGSDMQAT